MKLLILTQAVDENNPVLGFFVDWIKEFAKRCEGVIVICLFKGKYNLPDNVKVLSLGKEDGVSRIEYLHRFYKYIWQERKNYDSVFVHMNHIYAILGGWLWKIRNKKVGLWYAHKQVGFSPALAEKFVDIIFTASAKSFRIKSKKVKIVGHGIDTDKFKPRLSKGNNEIFKIVSAGRIAPIKNYETLIGAVELLLKIDKNKKIEVNIIGAPQTEAEDEYLNKLQKLVTDKKLGEALSFLGAVTNKEVVNHLQSSDLFVNMSQTGSLDKAVLEAMACGKLIITANESFIEILGDLSKKLILDDNNPVELADKIKFFMSADNQTEKQKIEKELREIVVNNHDLDNLVLKIIKIYGGSAS